MRFLKCKWCGKKGVYMKYRKKKIGKGWIPLYARCRYCGRRSE